MSSLLKEGMEFTIEKTVEPIEAACQIGSGGLEVFATPHMIALMERTAYRAVQSELPEGETTVGTEVNIKHLKATAIGKGVKCIAKLVKVDGRKLDFEVVVFEGEDKIGEGTHQRFIINSEKFMARLAK
jgi:fluoroacetyl-CoA thioesterase